MYDLRKFLIRSISLVFILQFYFVWPIKIVVKTRLWLGLLFALKIQNVENLLKRRISLNKMQDISSLRSDP